MADPKRATMVDRIGYFATIPLTFINDAEVSDRAHRLYVILRSYTSPDRDAMVFPGYETLRARCGWSNYRYVAQALRELETAGWIERKKRFGKSTMYSLNATPVLPTGVGMTDVPVLPTGVAPVLHPLVEEQEPENKNQIGQRAAADAAARAAGIDKLPSQRIVKAKAKKLHMPDPFDLGELEQAEAIQAHRRVCGYQPITVEQAALIVSKVNGTATTTWPTDLLVWTQSTRRSDNQPYRLDAIEKQVQFHMDLEVRRRNGAGKPQESERLKAQRAALEAELAGME